MTDPSAGGGPYYDVEFAPLPAAIQPDSCTETNVYASGGAVGLLAINGTADGDLPMGVQGTGPEFAPPGQFTSLAGVAYPAAGAGWQPVSLINGWSNGSPGDVVASLGGISYQLGS